MARSKVKESAGIAGLVGIAGGAVALLAGTGAAALPLPPGIPTGKLLCRTGAGRPCTQAHLADPVRYRQQLVLPTGYTSADEQVFRSDFETFVSQMGAAPGDTYSSHYRDHLIYIGHFVGAGALGTTESLFGGKVQAHPIRGQALTLRQNEVHGVTEELIKLEGLQPMAVSIIFNTTERVTANASPPSFIGKSYGVAKFTRGDLEGSYVPSHEVAHAALNFLDEYIEGGFEKVNITTLDFLSPFVLFNGSWAGFKTGMQDLFGTYNWRISEVLAANGGDNVDITEDPSRVVTPGYEPNPYEFEGGMFFGRGTYHDTGENLMNSVSEPVPGNGFGWSHSESQWSVLRQVFEEPSRAFRPNDRIRNAGPWNGWPFELGKKGKVFLFDGDKEHHFHRTQSYQVQVGWYDRHWETCHKGKLPYPCLKKEWVTVEKVISPERVEIDVPSSSAAGVLRVVQKVACKLGIKTIPVGGEKFDLCTLSLDEVADSFLPTLRFPAPYQMVEIPVEQLFTTFYWRFRTDNGTWQSGWTGWSKLTRTF